MVKPIYSPPPEEQKRYADVFSIDLSKVATFSIETGEEADDNVVMVVKHSPNYKPEVPGECIDRYALKKTASDSASVVKNFCNTTEGLIDTVEKKKGNGERWFALQSIFVPDAKPLPTPPLWGQAGKVVLQDVGKDRKILWSLANPKFDPLRNLWAVSQNGFPKKVEEKLAETLAKNGIALPPEKDLPAWKAFATFLESVDAPLKKLIEGWKTKSSVQMAATIFAGKFKNSQTVPSLQNLNKIKVLDPEERKTLEEEIKMAVFSAHPLISEQDLAGISQAVVAWMEMRLLFEVGAKIQKDKMDDPVPVGVPLDAKERDADFQRNLSDILTDKKATRQDVERIRRAYVAAAWGAQVQVGFDTVLVPSQTATDSSKDELVKFDDQVGIPTFKNLWRQRSALEEEQLPLVLKRLHAVLAPFPGTELTEERINTAKGPFAWSRLNFELAPAKEDLLEVYPAVDNFSEQTVLNFVREKIEEPGGEANKRYRLTTPAAYQIIDALKTPRENQLGAKPIRVRFANDVIGFLLKLGGGDHLELEPLAKEALTLSLVRDFPVTDATPDDDSSVAFRPIDAGSVTSGGSGVKTPLYKKWWFWTAVGAAAAAVAGGIYLYRNRTGNNAGTGGGNNMPPDNMPPDEQDEGFGTTTVGGP